MAIAFTTTSCVIARSRKISSWVHRPRCGAFDRLSKEPANDDDARGALLADPRLCRAGELRAETLRGPKPDTRAAVRTRRPHDGLGVETHRVELGRARGGEAVRRCICPVRSPRQH